MEQRRPGSKRGAWVTSSLTKENMTTQEAIIQHCSDEGWPEEPVAIMLEIFGMLPPEDDARAQDVMDNFSQGRLASFLLKVSPSTLAKIRAALTEEKMAVIERFLDDQEIT